MDLSMLDIGRSGITMDQVSLDRDLMGKYSVTPTLVLLKPLASSNFLKVKPFLALLMISRLPLSLIVRGSSFFQIPPKANTPIYANLAKGKFNFVEKPWQIP